MGCQDLWSSKLSWFSLVHSYPECLDPTDNFAYAMHCRIWFAHFHCTQTDFLEHEIGIDDNFWAKKSSNGNVPKINILQPKIILAIQIGSIWNIQPISKLHFMVDGIFSQIPLWLLDRPK